MAAEGTRAKRTNLVASRVHWSQMDPSEFVTAQNKEAHGNLRRDNIRKWLTTTVTEKDAKREPACKAAEALRTNSGCDDDLALGVEASSYGSHRVRTVQEFLRWSTSSPALSRLSSFSSATSGPSRPHSVMDILNLWNDDDPEEVLLDLGFGCDEPDLSGRIPARFINHQSQARGINLQVFLEAQKTRLDLENPDVSNRFRQLEVLQQVTTAFSSLVRSSSSSPLRAPLGKALSPEAWERRRRMGSLFRRASKKSRSQIHNQKTQDLTTPAATSSPCDTPELLQHPFSLGDKKVPSKRVKPGLLETVCLSPLAEDKGAGPDPQPQPNIAPLIAQEGALTHWPLIEGHPLTANTFLRRKKSPGQATESFEIEEIHSFDESSVTGGAEHLAQVIIRSNSCQSDSSGFLEEPFIPPLSQQASPGADLIKALSGLSGGSTESQSSERPASPSPSSPHTPPSPRLSSSLTSSAVNNDLLVSPSPSPKPSLAFSTSPSPVSLRLPKSDRQNSETETPPDQDQSSPASLFALVCEYLLSCSSSTELQNITHSKDLTLSSSSVFTTLSHKSFLMQPEEIKTEDKDAPSPQLSALIHDPEGTACSTCSSVPPPTSSPFSSPNLDRLFSLSIAMSSTQSDSFSGSPGNSQSEQTEVALHENSLSASCSLSSLLPLSQSSPPDFHCPASLTSPPLKESLLQIPENNHKDSFFPDSDGLGLCDPHKDEEETPSSLSFQLDKNNASAPSSLTLVSSEFEERSPTLPCHPRNPSFPFCQSALPSQSHYSEGLLDPAVGGISDLSGQSICQHDDTTDPAPTPPVQNIINVKIHHLSNFEDINQRNGKGAIESERHTDTVQTQETVVYISDTESSAGLSEGCRLVSEEVCNQTEIDPQLLSCSLHDELSTGTLPEQCQKEVNGSETELLRSFLVLHDDVPEAHSRTEVEPKDLIKIESLDRVFQTSVDDSEGETGDVDAFLEQLDTEGRVYWAEPIQVSNPSPVLEESVSVETSDGSPGNFHLPRCPAVLDLFPSTGRAMLLSLSSSSTMDTEQMSRNTTASSNTPSSLILAPFPSPFSNPALKTSSRSVSVQMSSSPSSHIIHRKDVPYITDSKRTLLPSVLPLDTSTPFRAVQSWTDLQIQRNPLTKKLSHGALHTAPKDVTLSIGATETTQGPTLNFSLSPSLPLLSNDWQSNDCLREMTKHHRTMSVSVDKGLWSDEEEEVDGNGNEEEVNLWKENQTATIACCCSCDHQCTCLTQKRCNCPYSLDELEEMMLCLQKFRSVLSSMEEQLSEEQATLYSALSDQDRVTVQDIKELRQAVKQEAGELEMQFNELADHYDNSLKMKMHRLLDEQSLLCSQLKVFLPAPGPISLRPAPNRTVATQCCLLPLIPPSDEQGGPASSWSTWNEVPLSESPPGSKCICEGPGCSPTKADKLDMMGFLQRLKESLHHSVNTDS